MKAYKVIVKGWVTGVGFRYAALREAGRRPKLAGWVRNADDDMVEAVVQGDEHDVSAMLSWFRRGPSCAKVEDFEIEEIVPDPLLGSFTIRD